MQKTKHEFFEDGSFVDRDDSAFLAIRPAPAIGTALLNNMANMAVQKTILGFDGVGDLTKHATGEMVCRGGLDTLSLALSVEWDEKTGKFEKLCEEIFAPAQNSARAGDAASAAFVIGEGDNPAKFVVRAQSAGGTGVYRHFVIEGSGMVWEISKCSAKSSDYYNCRVLVGSITCNTVSPQDIWDRVQLVFKIFGGRILANRVSRVDVFADCTNILPGKVHAAAVDGCMVTRAKDYDTRGKIVHGVQSFYIGKNPMLRVYDKLAELHAKPDQDKIRILADRFGGTIPDIVTRFEFQVRSRWLRDGGIETIQDLFSKFNGMCAYLCERFVRFTKRPVDHNHADRAEVVDWWQKITETFSKLSPAECQTFCRIVRRDKNSKGLIRQAVGCLLSAVGSRCASVAGFLVECYESIRLEVRELGLTRFDADGNVISLGEFERRLKIRHDRSQVEVFESALLGYCSDEPVSLTLSRARKRAQKAESTRKAQATFEEF